MRFQIILASAISIYSACAATSLEESHWNQTHADVDQQHPARTKREIVSAIITLIGLASSFATLYSLTYSKVVNSSHAEVLENFREVKNELRLLSYSLKDLEKTVKEQGALTSLHQNEEKIRNGYQRLTDLLDLDSAADGGRQLRRKYVYRLLRSGPGVKEAVESLFRSLITEQVTMKNLLRTIMDTEQCHFRKIKARSDEFVKLIQLGVGVYAACTAFMIPEVRNHEKELFTKYLNQSGLALENQLLKIQSECNDGSRLPAEIEQLLVESRRLNNKETAEKMWSRLSDKYESKLWFVGVYKEIYGFDNHCLNIRFYRFAGKTAFVVSWPQGQAGPKFGQPQRDFLKTYRPMYRLTPGKPSIDVSFMEICHAQQTYSDLSDLIKHPLHIAVMWRHTGVQWKHHPDVEVFHKSYQCNDVFVLPL